MPRLRPCLTRTPGVWVPPGPPRASALPSFAHLGRAAPGRCSGKATMSLCSDPHVLHTQLSGRPCSHPPREAAVRWRWGNGEGAGLQPPDERPRESAEWGPALLGSPGPGHEGGAVASFPTLPTARAVVLDTGHPQMLVGPAVPWAEEPGLQWGCREGPTVPPSHPETQNQPRVVRQGGGHLQPPASSEDTGHVL